MYSTQKVLEVAREAETERAPKRPRGRPHKRPIIEIEEEEEDKVSDYSSITSEDKLAVLLQRNT